MGRQEYYVDAFGTYSTYSSQHRAAAYEIKRLERADLAIPRLELARREFIEGDTQDGQTNLALFHNLMALAFVGDSSSCLLGTWSMYDE